MTYLIVALLSAIAGGVLTYFYHDAALSEAKHLKGAAEAERDLVKRQYNELIEKLHAK